MDLKKISSQSIEPTKRKRISNKEELKEQLEKLQIEAGISKTLRISLEEQLLTKEKLRKCIEQQLEEKYKKNHVVREAIERRKGS